MTGNDHWNCPLCADVIGPVDGGHWGGRKHAKAVWHELDRCNVSQGLPKGTYTNVVYPSQSLWLFKPGQPSSRGTFTVAVSLLDGACFLMEGDFLLPSRSPAASLPLAINYEPRIGG